jgi:tetratricopeptide (TPR) repeat protein
MKTSPSVAPCARVGLGTALVCLVLGACRGPGRAEAPDPERQFEVYKTTATYLYKDEALARAQEQAVKALEIHPEDRAMRQLLGWIRLRMGQSQDLIIAEEILRELLAEDAKDQATLQGLAFTLERLGLGYDQAARDFRSGARAVPGGTDRERAAADAEARAEAAWKESIALLERTLVDDEGSIESMNGLQRVLALLGRYPESLEWSARVLERSEKELAFWCKKLTEEDLLEREESLYRTNETAAVQLQIDTHLFAASVLHKLGRFEEAMQHLNAVAEVEPGLAPVFSQRAQLREKLGQFQRAIEDVDRYLKLSDAPFEHPDVRAAFDLRSRCEEALRQQARG